MSALSGLPLSADMRPDSDQVDLNINMPDPDMGFYRARDAKVGGTSNMFSDQADYDFGDDRVSENVDAASWSTSGVLSQSDLA